MIAQVLVWCFLGGSCWAQAPVSYGSWGRGPLSPLGRRLAARFPQLFSERPSPLPARLQGLYSRQRVEGRADDTRQPTHSQMRFDSEEPSQMAAYHREPLLPDRLDSRPITVEKTPSILQYSSDMDVNGDYSYKYETSDGVVREERSEMGEGGVATVRGSYSYPSPDGRTIHVSYVADHSGFRTIPTNKH